jgi:cytoskeleton protein RodZ
MADEVDNKAAGRFDDEPSPGARLREARLAKGLDTRDVAATLHVDPWMLDALEHDEYGALGAPVFAKGHLRKYAKVLGIDPDELMVAYYQRAGTRDTPPLIAESILRVEAAQRPRFGWLLPLAAGALAIGAVTLASMLYLRTDSGPAPARAAAPTPDTSRDARGERLTALPLPEPAPPATAEAPPVTDGRVPPAVTPSGATPAATDAAPARTGGDGLDRRIAVATSAEPPSQPAAQVVDAPRAPAPQAAADRVTLTLRFREESWVEVYDRDRAKLLYGLGETGSTRYLSGPPPLQVFLGKAGGVDVEVNGGDFAIPRGARRGNTARFSVDKPAP